MPNTNFDKRILITGGAGFIGSHLVRRFINKYPNYLIVNFDKLTYAGNLENLKDVESNPNYVFVKGDIASKEDVDNVFEQHSITDVINLAAESHVDRSVDNPTVFAQTNVIGTLTLLNKAKDYWKKDYSKHRFHHVSTDEVYGSLDSDPSHKFTEKTPYDPHSPYSASKAASDLFVKAYHDTFGLNITISNCSNNYGENQFPEKLIPLIINNLQEKKKIPVYGAGTNVRDWIYVGNHCTAIDDIFHIGENGETYNVGGNCEKTNLEVINAVMNAYCELTGESFAECQKLIEHIADPRGGGHDARYAIDSTKIFHDLFFFATKPFYEGIQQTVSWYLNNKEWLEHCKSGEYQKWIEHYYEKK